MAAFVALSLTTGEVIGSDEPLPTSTADLSVTLEEAIDPIIAGELSSCVVTVRNSGPGDASGVLVTDLLTQSGEAAPISYRSSRGGYDSETGVWEVGNLSSGSFETLTIKFRVGGSVPSGTVISNGAKVEGEEIDPDLGDNEASEDMLVMTEARLSVVVECQDLDGSAGDRPVYIVEITNNGPSDAREVWFKEFMPPTTWLKDARYCDGGDLDGAWIGFLSIGDMAAGETKTISVYGEMDPPSPSADGAIVTVSWMDTIDPVCNSEVFSCGADSRRW